MFLLDTNVISKLRRPDRANKNVITWASAIPGASFFLSAISILEIELGTLKIARRDPAQGAILRAWIDDRSCHASRIEFLPSIQWWLSAVRAFMSPIGGQNAMPLSPRQRWFTV